MNEINELCCCIIFDVTLECASVMSTVTFCTVNKDSEVTVELSIEGGSNETVCQSSFLLKFFRVEVIIRTYKS